MLTIESLPSSGRKPLRFLVNGEITVAFTQHAHRRLR